MNIPLRIVRGVIKNLAVHAGEEEFIRSEAQRTAGGVTAASLALGGLAGSAVGASIAATGGDSVEFFSCMVDGVSITGRFSKASFKDGDEVEVVVEGAGDALAVRRPADKRLWMFPHCSRGTRAHRRFSAILGGWILIALFVFSCALVATIRWGDNVPAGADLFALAISTVLSLISALYYSIRFLYQWGPIAKRAEMIFAVLGYPDPALVDLEKDHKRASKARGEGWPYLSDGPWIYRYPDELG